MKRTLYLECASGISGDMFAGAMLDLGTDQAGLLAMLESLKLEGVEYRIEKCSRSGFSATDFQVILHHHDHHDHHHDHHDHHHHHNEHRNLSDALAVIRRGNLTENAFAIAEKIFTIVAQAEAEVHGKPIDEVHFHEVGALDSIADIAAAAYCIDQLGIDEVIVCSLAEGTGFVHCAHGELPVPVPAVCKIAERFAIPLRITDETGEMTTPTGIAIAAALRTRKTLPENFVIRKTGIGCGKKEFKRPNLLRAMLLEENTAPAPGEDRIILLETNLDDCSGEQLALLLENLMAAGARDVHYIPAFMKKNRPGWLLRVICDPDNTADMEKIIFAGSTAIGLRKQEIGRVTLARRSADVILPVGTVSVKRSRWENGVICAPEYESVKALAESSGIPFADLYEAAKKVAETEENV